MFAEQIEALFALAIGFSFAGLVATGYQLVMRQPATFRQLQEGSRAAAFAAVPMLVFAAPFIIMRGTIRAVRAEGRAFAPAIMATVVAGCWSLMSGTVLVMAFAAVGPHIG
jgi:O-antigen/teichoic acid export membrane protein